MKIKSIVFAIISVFMSLVFCNMVSGAEPDKRPYIELVQALKNGEKSVNFESLRIAYTKTQDYDPYTIAAVRASMFDALDQKNYQDALSHAQEILKNNFVDIDAHMIATLTYQKLGDPEKARFHRFIGSGLIASIFSSGDGKSPATAWRVINLHEEYVILSTLGMRGNQSLVHKDGHDYDAFTIHDAQGAYELYFNIDIPYRWLQSRTK